MACIFFLFVFVFIHRNRIVKFFFCGMITLVNLDQIDFRSKGTLAVEYSH